MDDDELIHAARAGQDYAGPFLVSLYAPQLLGHVRNMAGDLGDEACELICENAVELALRRIDKFDPERGSFLTWARSIVKYAALDYRRSDERLRGLGDLDPVDEPLEPRRDVPDSVRAALVQALQTLNPGDQAILALIDVQGLTSHAAATHLNISSDAARQRHSRARRRLAAAARNDQNLLAFVEGQTT
jgi:RNA polymerase sigma factor (sigma-70 family)